MRRFRLTFPSFKAGKWTDKFEKGNSSFTVFTSKEVFVFEREFPVWYSFPSLMWIPLIYSCVIHPDDSPNHAPIAPVNIDSRIIELELEKCRLESQLSSAVNQEEFLALKETLEDTKETQSSYKVHRRAVCFPSNQDKLVAPFFPETNRGKGVFVKAQNSVFLSWC